MQKHSKSIQVTQSIFNGKTSIRASRRFKRHLKRSYGSKDTSFQSLGKILQKRVRGANRRSRRELSESRIPNFLPSSSRRQQGDAARAEQIQKSPTFCQAVRCANKGSRRELS